MNRKSVFLVLCFLLFPALACSLTDGIPGATPYATDMPGVPSAVTITPALAVSPTVASGSFSDFYAFGADIAQALDYKNAAFFEEMATPSDWNCLGDETQGVCLGQSGGQLLQGIAVTQDWKTYKLYSVSDYKAVWQAAFDKGNAFRLVALANQFGDNPLMPAADQSFLAILGAARPGVPVHVLYFEYVDGWRLRGELVASENGTDWLQGNCSTCYDTWQAWPK